MSASVFSMIMRSVKLGFHNHDSRPDWNCGRHRRLNVVIQSNLIRSWGHSWQSCWSLKFFWRFKDFLRSTGLFFKRGNRTISFCNLIKRIIPYQLRMAVVSFWKSGGGGIFFLHLLLNLSHEFNVCVFFSITLHKAVWIKRKIEITNFCSLQKIFDGRIYFCVFCALQMMLLAVNLSMTMAVLFISPSPSVVLINWRWRYRKIQVCRISLAIQSKKSYSFCCISELMQFLLTRRCNAFFLFIVMENLPVGKSVQPRRWHSGHSGLEPWPRKQKVGCSNPGRDRPKS